MYPKILFLASSSLESLARLSTSNAYHQIVRRADHFEKATKIKRMVAEND
jgi:hypothetical protein